MTTLEEALIPPGLHIVALDVEMDVVTIQARLATAEACCPGCARRSARVRSTYRRMIADLPWGERTVRLRVTVRRFACANPACPRRIFAEPLGTLAPRYARRSGRLTRALTAVAFALGGEAGARLARRLGLPASPDTLLRLIRRAPEPAAPAVRICGVDDFAWRKRRRYGTALVGRVRMPTGDPALTSLWPERAAALARAQARRDDSFAAIHAAAARGLNKSAIARALGVHRHTVQKYLALDAAPERRHATRRGSILAPYEGYLRGRWRQGCRDARALWHELQGRGYPGSYRPVARAVRHLRLADAAGRADAAPGEGLTPPQAVGLLLMRPSARTPRHASTIEELRALHLELGTAITLLERFAALNRPRDNPGQEGRLAGWLTDAGASALPEVAAFAVKLRQDLAVVRAGLTLPWSQGQVEGQILKLKMLRRQMYGRGNFDLVRKRALHAA